MDFDNENGVKNFAWFDSEKLFSKNFCQPWLTEDKMYKPPTYTDYNPDVFKKFLALYLYDYAKWKQVFSFEILLEEKLMSQVTIPVVHLSQTTKKILTKVLSSRL